jgi:type VI secretion system FHA domain protein
MLNGWPMPLTLTIRNADYLDNGSPLSLVLDRRGATIGRSATADWCLPDPERHISSRHCEIRFDDGCYSVIDISTNGTFLKGDEARLPGPHVIRPGDVLIVGGFEIETSLDDRAASAAMAAAAQPPVEQWKGWADTSRDAPAAPAISSDAWNQRPAGAAISGDGALARNWTPPSVQSPAGPARWPDEAPTAAAHYEGGSANVWDSFAESNRVDWARGGLDRAAPEPAPPPPPVAAPAPAPAPRPDNQTLPALLAAAGLSREDVGLPDTEAGRMAGDLLRRLVAGLVVMLEARARAKNQLGAQGTRLELDGNNPLKFARSPEDALKQLLNPSSRGFMTGERAIEDAFKDLQAHQMATLRAMQGALKATLDRFSPKSIRARAEDKGVLAKILPGATEAALWKAYEREFSGVARGSDEAFMDIFAKEFRKAYDEITQGRSGY